MRCIRLLLVLLIIFPSFSLSAQNTKVSRSDHNRSTRKDKPFPISGCVALSIDTMIGECHEYVLHGGRIVSDLKWPLTPSVSYGVSGSLYLGTVIHLDGELSLVQPMSTRPMTDTDFLGMLKKPASPGITHFSEHNCTITGGMRWRFRLGVPISLPQSAFMKKTGIAVTVEPIIGISSSTLRWCASGGYVQYSKKLRDGTFAPWTHTLPKLYYDHENVLLSYQQHILIPTIGCGCITAFPHKLSLSTSVHVGPTVFAATQDMHYARNLKYVDRMTGGWAIQGEGRLNWNCISFFSVFITLCYRYCSAMNGSTDMYKDIASGTPSAHLPPPASGTSLHEAAFSGGFEFRIGR